jgi:hypothetical protein
MIDRLNRRKKEKLFKRDVYAKKSSVSISYDGSFGMNQRLWEILGDDKYVSYQNVQYTVYPIIEWPKPMKP